MSDQVLERFHRALIEEIQTQRPEYLTQPFTVAEIYQNLVPYGSHRDRIGVEMNGDYEDALVRLLAGEGGYLILESDRAVENLRSELESSNPNTGVYREFAAVDVRLNQAYLDLSFQALDELPDLAQELEAEDPVAMAELAPAEGYATAEELGVVPPGVDIFADAPQADSPGTQEAALNGAAVADETQDEFDLEDVTDDEEPDAADGSQADDVAATRRSGRPPLEPEFVEEEPMVDGDEAGVDAPEAEASPATGARPPGAKDGSCVWCRADLPDRKTLNYCPYCGTDLDLVPCRECGEEIEPGWRFCVSCGTGVDG